MPPFGRVDSPCIVRHALGCIEFWQENSGESHNYALTQLFSGDKAREGFDGGGFMVQ